MVEVTVEQTNRDVLKLKKKVELSEYAKQKLKEARETPESAYVDL